MADTGDVVFRRLADSSPNMLRVDSVTGEKRPTSGAFKPDSDGVSVYRRSILRSLGLGPAALVLSPANLVVSIPEATLAPLGLGILDDPWPADIPEQDHPRNAAHALIVGWDGLSNSERRKKQRLLAADPALRFEELAA